MTTPQASLLPGGATPAEGDTATATPRPATAPAAPPDPGAAGAPSPTVYGIDLSLTATGIASSAGWCELVGRTGITTMSLADRSTVLDGLVEQIILLVGNADLLVIEAPAFSRAGGGASERHGLYWRLIRRLLSLEIPIAEVTTGGLKKYATGKGNADKGAVVDAVARRWPGWHTGGNDNLADAVALMAMGLDHTGHPAAAMPRTHRAALDKVAWPELPNLTKARTS